MNSRHGQSTGPKDQSPVNNRNDVSLLPLSTQQSIIKSLFGACDTYLTRCREGLGEESQTFVEPGRKLEILRLVRDLSQKELAQLAGVSQTEVSRAETNFHSVRYESLKNICAVLGTTVASLDDHPSGAMPR